MYVGLHMLLYDRNNEIIYKGSHKTSRSALSFCAKNAISLKGIHMRKKDLGGAMLDGLCAPDAVFWGCDFSGADMGYADLQDCDLRCSNLEEACLAHTDLSGADLRGAYFKNTILEGVTLCGARISCPSFWGCDVFSSKSLRGLVYVHRGEVEIPITNNPLIIMGKVGRIVLFGEYCLMGHTLFHTENVTQTALQMLDDIGAQIDEFSAHRVRKMKTHPMPKIEKNELFIKG